MNELFKIIKERQSIRKFIPEKQINDEDIISLLETAIAAPTGGNVQPWKFYVIKNKEIKQKLLQASYGQSFIIEADTVIVVCADIAKAGRFYGKRGETLYAIQDTAAATQNMLLYAWSIGIGSCWVGAFNDDEVIKTLNLPDYLKPVAILPFGYFETKPEKPDRKRVKEVSEWLR